MEKKELLPCWLFKILKCTKNAFLLFPVYFYWFGRDVRHNSCFSNEQSDLANLLVSGHVLEKGITMPNRKLGFGYERVRSLIKKCSKAIQKYSNNHIEVQCTLKDLEQYLQIHQQEEFKLPEDITIGIKELLQYKLVDTQPCFEISKDEYFKKTNDFFEFAHQRHSVRWYAEDSVDKETLIKAIQLAQTAPSACNRQSSKVYIIETDEKKRQVLQIQNGNRGFGHLADKILLITTDMRFWSYKERTSAFLDAGIYLMNLLYALHYYNICACTLNATMSIRKNHLLCDIIGCTKSEIPVAFITIGKAADNFYIPGSQRKEYNQIISFI